MLNQVDSVPNAVERIMAEKRDAKRVKAVFSASVHTEEGFLSHCVIKDVSNTGMQLKFTNGLDLPDNFHVKTPAMNEMIPVQVAWTKRDTCGVSFIINSQAAVAV
jgi:hypothetical protein